MTSHTPVSRVSEFIRQWTLPPMSNRGDEIYMVRFEKGADDAQLLASDIKSVIEDRRELLEALEVLHDIAQIHMHDDADPGNIVFDLVRSAIRKARGE